MPKIEFDSHTKQLGTTAIGIQTSEGVILAVEKRVSSPLMEPSSIEKVLEIDYHIGCAMSGMTADARTMIDHARVIAQVWNLKNVGLQSTRCTNPWLLAESQIHLRRKNQSREYYTRSLRSGITI